MCFSIFHFNTITFHVNIHLNQSSGPIKAVSNLPTSSAKMVTMDGFGFGCVEEEKGALILQIFAGPRLVSLTTVAAHGHVPTLLLSRLSGSPAVAPKISLGSGFN